MYITQPQIHSFQQKILSWYSNNKRDLPWRHTHDPYKILLSEVMSQQTQLSRVIPKYQAWLQELPNFQSLACAPLSQILSLWSGLGYNRRALYLQQTAQIIIQKHNGLFPQALVEIKKLPGVGEYTASAVLCFAFNQQIPVVDTNIRKVILTQFIYPQKFSILPSTLVADLRKNKNPEAILQPVSLNIDSKPEKKQETNKIITQIAREILPDGKAYDWNQALMDYASTVLKTQKIPIPKQSRLIGSDRWYRGQIIKLLIKGHSLSQTQLFNQLEKETTFNLERYEKILNKLIKDNMIKSKDNIIQLA